MASATQKRKSGNNTAGQSLKHPKKYDRIIYHVDPNFVDEQWAKQQQAAASGASAANQMDSVRQYEAEAKTRREESYRRESTAAAEDAAVDLRAEYIKAKNSGRQLPQVMAAEGLSGGAMRAAHSKIAEGYSAAREALTLERDRELARLKERLDSGLAGDREKYQNRLLSLSQRYQRAMASIPQSNSHSSILYPGAKIRIIRNRKY